jgi:hypothetical protein
MSFLRKIFGPDQAEVWQRLADETGGQFVDGGFFGKKKVLVKVKEWTIVLDTYTVSSGKHSTTYTRMRAPYVNKDNFRFRIYRSNFLVEFAKKLGLQDIDIGDPQFDRDFIIKSNSPEKVRALLAYPKLRELISAQPRISFEVKEDEGVFGQSFPEGVDELCFHVAGVIRDVEQLKSLFTLFALTLNYLCHIDSAYETDPQIVLK